MDPVLSRDARTGQPRSQVAAEAGPAEVDAAVRAAHATLGALADRRQRAELLRAAAEAAESRADALIAAADAEAAPGTAALEGPAGHRRRLRGVQLPVRVQRPGR